MEVSFILSANEIFTLISQTPEHTESGERFIREALAGAQSCDLTSLVKKKLAHITDNELELEPVLYMLITALSHADNAENCVSHWEIQSPWVSLRCESYPFKAGYWRLSPVKGMGV
jgi:hypothetical protein